jgi:hypothetical protein
MLIMDNLTIFKVCPNSLLMMTMMIKMNRKNSKLRRKKTKMMKRMNLKEALLIYITFSKVLAHSSPDLYLVQQLLLNNSHRSQISINLHLTKYKTYSRCKMILLLT